jgi:hypothetical protein
MIRRASLLPVALLSVATVAFPCGGSTSYDVDGPLHSAATFADRGFSPWYELESYSRDEVRFLPGVMKADSARVAGLVGRPPAHYWSDTLRKPALLDPTASGMEVALSAGDVAAAAKAAEAIVSRVLALPSFYNPGRDSLLRSAVEVFELAPAIASQPVSARRTALERLAAPYRAAPLDSMPAMLLRAPTSPRRASLEYAALRLAVRDGIPNDSREEIAKQVPPARWDSLHAAHRAWLLRHANHPLVGYVRFARLRLFYLASQADSAWDSAIALYRDYPARAAGEMRYMLLTGMTAPDRLLTDARVPVELRVALVGNLTPRNGDVSTLFRLASANRQATWADNLEERVMATFARDWQAPRTLPAAFPAWRASASPFWKYMWAASMLRAGRLNDAVRIAHAPITLAQDSILAKEGAMLTARIHMMRGDWPSALQVPLVDVWTRRYMLRVLAPDSVASALVTSRDPMVAKEARLVVATRASQAGRWDEAAAIVRPSDAARAARYARLGALSLDTASSAGLSRFAKAIADSHGALFYEATRYFYRGMQGRDYALTQPAEGRDEWELPWAPTDERRRMHAYFRSSAERYLALRMYASLLSRPDLTAAQRKAAVREADAMYRGLQRTDSSRPDDGYWADSLPQMPEVRVIRRAGRG